MIGRLRERLPESRRERAALGALLLLLAVGGGLRLLLMLAQRPGFLGYADSYVYVGAGKAGLFSDPLRPAGYPIFLRIVHALNENLSFTTLVQHGLGIASALLLFLAVRRVISSWWALLPAAVILLAGPQILLEHALLSESLFVFLQAAAIYAAARSLDGRAAVWAPLAGALVAAGALTRTAGLLLLPVLLVWLGVAISGALPRRLLPAGLAVLAAAIPIAAYVVAQNDAVGYAGLTRAGGWNLYGRVGPFANCERFDPPRGTRVLCERRPESRRPGSNNYIFHAPSSPAIQAYGTLFETTQEENDRVSAFAREALLGQPLDWIDMVVTEELPRYVDSDHEARPGVGLSFRYLQDSIQTGPQIVETANLASTWYSTSGGVVHQGLLDAVLSYARWTRPEGVIFVVLALLCLLAPLAPGGPPRMLGVLLLAIALVDVIGPPAALYYDARYAIPAFGPLAAGAALGGFALSARWRARRAE